jgi:hypothetical protein
LPMACPAGWAGPWSPPPPGWSRPDSGGEPVPQRVSGGRRDWLFGRSPQPPATDREIHRARNRDPVAGTIQSAAGRALARAPKTRPPSGGRRSHYSVFEYARSPPNPPAATVVGSFRPICASPPDRGSARPQSRAQFFAPRVERRNVVAGVLEQPLARHRQRDGPAGNPCPPQFPLPFQQPAAQRRRRDALRPVWPRPTAPRGAPPGRATGEEGDAPPRRASIVAMVASKLSINARMPESVRVSMHLRWLGSLPGRVPVNARERFSHESVPTACFHPPPGRRGPAPGPPSGGSRPSPASAPSPGGLTALLSPKRAQSVLEPSSNRPRTVPPGSRQRPATGLTPPTRRGGRPGGRCLASPSPPPLTSRSAASFCRTCPLQFQPGA